MTTYQKFIRTHTGILNLDTINIWAPPQKPAEAAEERLILGILEGRFPIDSVLPGERELSVLVGVTRPTLREALQRLARDGWVEIQHGKPTRVRNFWEEGNLGVLAALVQHPAHLPPDFVSQLLQVRLLLAPTYTQLAVERQPERINALAARGKRLPDQAGAFAAFDWDLHVELTKNCGNPVFTLILNGFRDLYPMMASLYFQAPAARETSREFYAALAELAQTRNGPGAKQLAEQVMLRSIQLWQGYAASQPESTKPG
jgi:GntR family negative regulator for fad regulon and positive regulator of fabA